MGQIKPPNTMIALRLALLVVVAPSMLVLAEEPVDYNRDIKPLLKARCYACHGALKQKAGLRLDSGDLIRQGGKHGSVLNTNAVEESALLQRVSSKDPDERMPPEGEPLAADQIEKLRHWIAAGAPSPAGEKPETDPKNHWAFKKPVRSAIPEIRNEQGKELNPIDAFIAAGMAKQNLKPAPPALKEALLRRVYLDLIGLPPTRAQFRAFLADTRPDAYERVVDELLASPHHGERWARHWMDVWRYSDWYGRRHVPDVWNSAPQIWRWRDWIVRSLNTDKGYDRMVVEMLAGDEVAPEDDEIAVATGFLVRNWYALNPNQWMRDNVEHTAKAFLGLTFNCAHCHDHKYDPISHREYFQFRAFFEPLGLRQDWVKGEPDPGPFQKYEYVVLRKVVKHGTVRVLDENLDAKTYIYLRGDERAFPEGKPTVEPGVPAVFEQSGLRLEGIQLPVPTVFPGAKSWVRETQLESRFQAIDEATRSLREAEQKLAAARDLASRMLKNGDSESASGKAAPGSLAGRAAAFVELLRAETAISSASNRLALAEAELASHKARLAADAAWFLGAPGNTNELASAASQAERQIALFSAQHKLADAENSLALRQAEHALAAARRVVDKASADADKKAAETEDAAVKKAAEQIASLKKSVESAQAALATNSFAYTPISPTYPARSTGRRRALAQWIASRENPLAARVAVNHIWSRHFHVPLVKTVFDFGRNGTTSTHPELLDWLAVEFMENGWSMKHLHRLIVTSAAYRRASSFSSASTEGLFAQASAQSAELEANRSVDPENLALARMNVGRLESEIVRDTILHVSGELDTTRGGYPLANTEADQHRRRSLYFECFPEGGGSAEFAGLFDPPDPMECYRRTKTIVPQQALGLTNSKLIQESSRALARKLWEESQAQLKSRSTEDAAGGASPANPDPEAAFISAAFEQVLTRRISSAELAACREFLARQTSLFQHEPASSAGDSGQKEKQEPLAPEARARIGLVRALFNHNDFVTIR